MTLLKSKPNHNQIFTLYMYILPLLYDVSMSLSNISTAMVDIKLSTSLVFVCPHMKETYKCLFIVMKSPKYIKIRVRRALRYRCFPAVSLFCGT